MKFTKKPVEIEAKRYTRNGLEAEQVAQWSGGEQTDEGLVIHTLEGDHLANYGDWIIKGVEGEFYPCKPSIFEKTYRESCEELEFQRQDRYIVIKRSDVEKLPYRGQERLNDVCEAINNERKISGKKKHNYVVVSDSWPMYEFVWKMIEEWVKYLKGQA